MSRFHHAIRAAVGGAGGVQPDIPRDFIARYVFNGDFTDETGNYNGTNTNSTFLAAGDGPGGSNVGINTGGASKYVNLPTSIITAIGTGANTIVYWIRSSAATNIAQVLTSADNTVATRFYACQLGNATNLFPRYIHLNNAPTNIVRGTTAASINTWVPVIVRTSGTATSFRLNGVNLGKAIDAGSDSGNSISDITGINKITIGRIERAGLTITEAFDLGPMTIYSRELSDSECAQLEAEY